MAPGGASTAGAHGERRTRRARTTSARQVRARRRGGRGGVTVGGIAGMRALDVRREGGQPARVDRAPRPGRAAISPAVVLTATGRASEAVPDIDEVEGGDVGEDLDAALAEALGEQRRRRRPGRRGPSRCRSSARGSPGSPNHAGTLRGSWPPWTAWWVASVRSRWSLKRRSTRLVEHQPAGQQLLGRLRQPLDARRTARTSRGAAGPRPRPGRGRSRPTAGPGSAPLPLARLDRPALRVLGGAEGLVDRGELGGAAAGGQAQHGAVGEAVLAHRVDRHQLELLLQRPAGLAEEVAQHGGERGGGRAGVPGEAVLLEQPRAPRPASGSASTSVTSWPSLARRAAAGAAGQPAADDHHA